MHAAAFARKASYHHSQCLLEFTLCGHLNLQVVQLQCMRQGVLYPPQVSLTYGGMAVDYEDELECEDEAGHFL
jgi:hypothetical protein